LFRQKFDHLKDIAVVQSAVGDFVHQGTNYKNTPPVLIKLFDVGSREPINIKSLALVKYFDIQASAVNADADVYFFLGILFVAVKHGIGDRFREDKINVISQLFPVASVLFQGSGYIFPNSADQPQVACFIGYTYIDFDFFLHFSSGRAGLETGEGFLRTGKNFKHTMKPGQLKH
jgi:hypothetical protein